MSIQRAGILRMTADRFGWVAFAAVVAVLAMLANAHIAAAGPVLGQPAPPFTATDSNGKTVSLTDFRGKVVVLEWTNHECPFVQRHYESGNMQALQKAATADGVIWLSIVSSAPKEQGNVTPAEANKLTASRGAVPTAVLLDPMGTIGHLYGAKTTPHMFVIDAAGTLVYMGAIDDQPRNTGATPAAAHNYVREALAAIESGQPVATPLTQSYGCSVKYGT